MGTRGFVGFVVAGVEKIAYNHFDSYPEGLGVDILSWVRGRMMDVGMPTAQDAIDELRESVRVLRVVDPRSEPTGEDVKTLAAFTDPNVGERTDRPTWYQLLRRTQGNPTAMLSAGVIEDASDFPADSLFAEWGYVVDLDVAMFEVYRGFQDEQHDKGRFAGREATRSGYAPCALLASWPLRALPDKDDFLRTCDAVSL